MKSKINEKIEKLMPPGADVIRVRNTFIAFTIVMILDSFLYFNELGNAIKGLYYQGIGIAVKIFMPGAEMPTFENLIHRSFFGLLIIMLYAIVVTVQNYLYYYRKSKSIYVMKRLNNPLELHIRALGLTVAALAAAILIVLVLTALYALLYVKITPAGYAHPIDFVEALSGLVL